MPCGQDSGSDLLGFGSCLCHLRTACETLARFSDPFVPQSPHLQNGSNNSVDPLASLVAQRVKRLPAVQETRVESLGREDILEKEMAPHSSTLAWKIPWTEEPGRLRSTGSQRVGHD